MRRFIKKHWSNRDTPGLPIIFWGSISIAGIFVNSTRMITVGIICGNTWLGLRWVISEANIISRRDRGAH